MGIDCLLLVIVSIPNKSRLCPDIPSFRILFVSARKCHLSFEVMAIVLAKSD